MLSSKDNSRIASTAFLNKCETGQDPSECIGGDPPSLTYSTIRNFIRIALFRDLEISKNYISALEIPSLPLAAYPIVTTLVTVYFLFIVSGKRGHWCAITKKAARGPMTSPNGIRLSIGCASRRII